MKRFLFIAGLAASMSSLFAVPVPLTNSQISPDLNSYINFLQNDSNGAGNTEFTFVNSPASTFFSNFTSASPSATYGALDTLKVDINGAFDIVAGSLTTDAAGNQIASIVNDPATGLHQLEIFGNGTGNNQGILTADLQWVNILSNSYTTGQNLNIQGALNLSNFHYQAAGGSLYTINDTQAVQDALNSIVNTAPGRLTLSVTGTGLPQISQLLGTGAHWEIGDAPDNNGVGAFSMNLSTVPEPRFYGLLLVGLLGIAAIVVKRKSIA